MVTVSAASEIWTDYRETQDPQLLEEIVERYAPLVKYVAGRMAINLPSILESGDIIDYGIIGLLNAIRRFDPDRNVKFETFAISLIRGAIIDALRALDPVSRSMRQKSKSIWKASSDLQLEFGRPASDQEIADRLGMSIDTYKKVLTNSNCTTYSLDYVGECADGEEQTSLFETIGDDSSPNPLESLQSTELRQSLIEAINKLPQRERLIISLYYNDGMTLAEISNILEVSQSRVCQLHSKIIANLRRALKYLAPDNQ